MSEIDANMTVVWIPYSIYFDVVDWCYNNDQIIGGIYQVGEPGTLKLRIKDGRAGLQCDHEEDATMIAMHWLGKEDVD